jgi:hypothetical protein
MVAVSKVTVEHGWESSSILVKPCLHWGPRVDPQCVRPPGGTMWWQWACPDPKSCHWIEQCSQPLSMIGGQKLPEESRRALAWLSWFHRYILLTLQSAELSVGFSLCTLPQWKWLPSSTFIGDMMCLSQNTMVMKLVAMKVESSNVNRKNHYKYQI